MPREPLQDGIARVLAQDLAQHMPSAHIVHPWPPSRVATHQLVVDVQRFDATLGGDARLAARWWVLDETGRSLLIERREQIVLPAPVDEDEPYVELVGVMSELLAQLSREVAAELKRLR
jgi:uncharacterized lipoprotein YmbA